MDRKLALTILLNGVDKLSGPLRSVASQSKLAALALRENRAELRQMQAQANDIAGFRRLKTGLSETEQKWKAAEERAAALAREMRALEQPTRAMAREFDKASREAGRLKQEHTEQAAKLQTLRGRLSDAGIATRNLSEHERKLRSDMARTNQAIDQQKDRLERLGRIQQQAGRMRQQADSAIAAGQQNVVQGSAILAPFVLATRNAMEFSSGMVDIQQKFELTNAEIIKMRGLILAASRATHQLPEDMRAAVDVLAGFGMDPRQAVMLTEPIGRLGTAMKVDLADAAAAAYANINNLKVPIGETARAFDIMAAAGNAGAFEIRDMARWFPQLTGQARALGQEGTTAVADLSAALQIARRGAGSADQAANNVANLMAKINSAETIRKFQQHFGIDLPAALDAAYAKGKTPLEAIAELANKATGGDLRKLSFVFEDQQAQSALRSLILDMEDYRKIRSDIANSGGTIDAAFDQRVLNDGMVAWQAFKVQLAGTALTLGTDLLPVASQFLTIVGGMASAVGDFAEANPELTTGLLYLVAGTGAAKLALGGLQLAFGGILGPATTAWEIYQNWKTAGSVTAAFPKIAKGFTLLRTAALFMARGVMQAGLMMMANPMVLAITAIAVGIGVAAYLIYTHWDTIKAAFDTAVGWIGSTWEWLKAKFMAAPALFGPLGLVAHAVITHWDAIKGGFDTAMGWMGTAWEWIRGKLHLLPALFNPLALLGGLVTSHWSAVRGAFSAGTAMIGQAWQTIRGAFGEGIAWLQSLGGQMVGYGRAIIAGLVRGINAAPGAVWAALKAIVLRGVENIRAFLGIKSPSRLFAEMGGFMTEGLAIGVDGSAPQAVGAARRMAVAVAAAMAVPTVPAPAMAEPQAPRLPVIEALRIQSAIAAPQLPQPEALVISAGIAAPQAPRLPAIEALRIQSAIAAPALPQLPQPDALAIGAGIAAPQAPRLPMIEALRIQSAIAAPALPALPQPPGLAIGANIEEPAAPRLPALGRMRLPVDLDIARQLDLPEALMRVLPQLAPIAAIEARQQALRPQAQFAPPADRQTREDRAPLRSSAPAAGNTYNFTIQQLPGENAEQLARRVADIIDRQASSRRLGAYRDE